jgi:hypothetical protein
MDELLLIIITTANFFEQLISVVFHHPGTIKMKGPYEQKARYADVPVQLYICDTGQTSCAARRTCLDSYCRILERKNEDKDSRSYTENHVREEEP